MSPDEIVDAFHAHPVFKALSGPEAAKTSLDAIARMLQEVWQLPDPHPARLRLAARALSRMLTRLSKVQNVLAGDSIHIDEDDWQERAVIEAQTGAVTFDPYDEVPGSEIAAEAAYALTQIRALEGTRSYLAQIPGAALDELDQQVYDQITTVDAARCQTLVDTAGLREEPAGAIPSTREIADRLYTLWSDLELIHEALIDEFLRSRTLS